MEFKTIQLCICLIFITYCVSDKIDSWRYQRASFTPPPIARPPPYYTYTTYVQRPIPSPKKPSSDAGPTMKFGSTGISGATGECAPGIPKCAPRVGRRDE